MIFIILEPQIAADIRRDRKRQKIAKGFVREPVKLLSEEISRSQQVDQEKT